MSFTFVDLQTEVKGRSIMDQSGTTFDTRIKNSINTSLFRIAREAAWKVLRRTSTISTEISYTTGTGAVTVTNGSKNVTVTGATLITNGIQIGRRVALGGSAKVYRLASITGETTFTVDVAYDGTTSSTQSYKIYGREEYNLPIQAGRIALVWHEDFGYPIDLTYITDPDFYSSGVTPMVENTPLIWRQWGANNVITQPYAASVMRIASSSSSDISKNVTIWGTVSGYPDFETITTNASNGTTAVSGSKSFSSVERVTKDDTTVGRITVDANSANTTVAVLPVGDTTGMVQYLKIQFYPLATRVFPINIEHYKDPWRLVSDSDMHEMGGEFDEAIILLATAKMNYAQGKTSEGDKFILLYKDEIANLKKYNSETALNWKPALRRAGTTPNEQPHRYLGYGQVGGYYGPRVG